MIVIPADAELLGFALLCAVTTTAADGTVAGAVYRPAEVIFPTEEFPSRTPDTSQFTVVLLVPVTAALNCWECPVCTLALIGETETEMVAGMIETVALADTVG